MAGGTYTSLKGVDAFPLAGFDEQIVENLISFLDWGLLCKGAFFNVPLGTGLRSKLKMSTASIFAQGQEWESTESNWVWETNIPYQIQPFAITGVNVNNVNIPNDGTSYYIDYKNGNVIFTAPQDPASIIKLRYSYKKYNFYDSNNSWFRQVIMDPINNQNQGEILDINRVYLPAVIVEYVPNIRLVPYQLGSGLTYHEYQDLLLHVLADNPNDRNKFVNIITKQFDKTFHLYDLNAISADNAEPLDSDGSLKPNPLTYPQLVDTYYLTKCTFSNIIPQEITAELGLYRAAIRVTLQVDSY